MFRFALAGLIATAATTFAQFTLQLSTSTSAVSTIGNPSINNNGVIAFAGNLDAGGSGLFTVAAPNMLNTVVTSAGTFSNFGNPNIKNASLIAFSANNDDATSGVYTSTFTGTLSTIATSTSPLYSSFNNPWINTSGTVVFGANLDTGGSGIYRGSTSANVAAVVDSSSPTFASFGVNSINDAGTVAFRTIRDDSTHAVYTASSGGTVTLIAQPNGGQLSTFNGTPVVNNSGLVAFRASNAGVTANGIFTATSSASYTTIADSAGPVYSGLGNHFLNNNNELAFLGNLDGTTDVALFLYKAGVAQQIVRTGQAWDGSAIGSINFGSNGGMNDSGLIAFGLVLADGRTLLYTYAVPEPGCLAVLGVVAILAARRRHRSNSAS